MLDVVGPVVEALAQKSEERSRFQAVEAHLESPLSKGRSCGVREVKPYRMHRGMASNHNVCRALHKLSLADNQDGQVSRVPK